MRKNSIDLSIIYKNNKKKYHETIFMPKFLVNMIHLSKKAEKISKKYNHQRNPELILDFKTTFNHMPKLNFLSHKESNNDSDKTRLKKLKFISLLQNPERVIIKQSLPKITYNVNSTNYDNNNKINEIKDFSVKIKNPEILKKSNSCLNMNFSTNKNTLRNLSIPQRNSESTIPHNGFTLSRNGFHKQIRTEKDSISRNSLNKSINIISMHNNKNQISIMDNIESHLKNKFKKFKLLGKEANQIINNNNMNINELYLQKEMKSKEKDFYANKIYSNLSIKKIDSLPDNFKSKGEIINSYLNKNSFYIKYSINISPEFNLNTNNIYHFNINKMYRRQMIDYMKHRINWQHIEYSSINTTNSSSKNYLNINFEWKYYSNRINYKKYKYTVNTPNKKLRMINLFEKNNEIGNKKNMFLNLITYCDEINYNIFDVVPFTMIFSNSKDIDCQMNSLKEIMDFLEENKNSKKDLIINKLYKNHFCNDKNFENIDNQILFFNKNFISDKNYWILKPTDMYQGKYIEISNTYDDIYRKCMKMFKGVNNNLSKEIMEIEEENQKNENNYNSSTNIKKKFNFKKSINPKMYCCNDIIIQKYLDNPLLYKKRKFDIRCFALLDSNLNLYYCKEGHLKGSSELYNVEKSNKFIHITNYSFQKKTSSFERYEFGNEISYTTFKQFLKEEGFPPDKFNSMIEDMKFLIKISFKSVRKKIYKIKDVLCFELFGYDFIIDNEFKPWILEINNNPGLGISSPVIQKIIPRMIDDAFRLTIDKVFNTIYDSESFDENGKYKTRFPIEGYKSDENIFEFLCNIK